MGHRCHALTVPEDISAQNLKVFFVLWELSGDSLKYQYYIYFIIIMRTLFSIGNQASCTLCPAGYACPSIFTNVMVACEIGYYSPVGSSVCLQCPSVRHTIYCILYYVKQEQVFIIFWFCIITIGKYVSNAVIVTYHLPRRYLLSRDSTILYIMSCRFPVCL